MARHEVVIHENTSASKDVAPYLGSYIAKETVQMDAFANAVGAKCGLPGIQVMAILGGAFEAIEGLESDALLRIWTDLGVVCGVIRGSFPTADAPFDPDRNSLELCLRLDDSIRNLLADTVPTIITDVNLTRLRVDNVMDLEEERPMNLIHGRHVFRVAGFNMVLSDQDATVFLENGLGTTFPVVVDEVVSKQLFKAHTAELIPAGDYKLVVKSRAGDAAGPLQTAFRRVKYLRVEDPGPRIDNVANQGDPTAHDEIANAMDVIIEGSLLQLGAGDEVTIDGVNEGVAQHVVFGVDAAEENTDARLVLDYMSASSGAMAFDPGSNATVTVKGVAHAVKVASGS